MKRLNWGWRIVIFYGSFVAFMLFLVWKTTTVNVDLVAKDYYAKELQFQEQLDKQNRANKLKEPLQWNVNQQRIELKFPKEQLKEKVKAEILFYKPSDDSQDFKVSCVPDSSGLCAVSSEKLQHGVYQMKIDWSAGDVTYYNEGVIRIN